MKRYELIVLAMVLVGMSCAQKLVQSQDVVRDVVTLSNQAPATQPAEQAPALPKGHPDIAKLQAEKAAAIPTTTDEPDWIVHMRHIMVTPTDKGLTVLVDIEEHDGIAGAAPELQVGAQKLGLRSIEIFVQIGHEGDRTLAEIFQFVPEFGHARIDIVDVLLELLSSLVAERVGRFVKFDRHAGQARRPLLQDGDHEVAVARTECRGQHRETVDTVP